MMEIYKGKHRKAKESPNFRNEDINKNNLFFTKLQF